MCSSHGQLSVIYGQLSVTYCIDGRGCTSCSVQIDGVKEGLQPAIITLTVTIEINQDFTSSQPPRSVLCLLEYQGQF